MSPAKQVFVGIIDIIINVVIGKLLGGVASTKSQQDVLFYMIPVDE
jgi:hypothetical protein